MIIPPIVGIPTLCNFRASPGSSTNSLRKETLISAGMESSTMKKEVINPNEIVSKTGDYITNL